MNFISGLFLLFFMVTLAAFVWVSPKFRQSVLLVASYVFYATWSIPFISVILITTTTDYWISHFLWKTQNTAKRKAALWLGIGINLIILGFFKYANFFIDNTNSLLQWIDPQAAALVPLHIILPLGISFYTFEAISYMVDVYRGKEPARNWLDYNFYIMYFPHLISGPIIRFCELWPQYNQPLTLPSAERLTKGFELIILGALFKVLIADQAAILSDATFAQASEATALQCVVGALAFTVQIYFDFMGYTHIARGASLFFNIELPLNFNHPYHANTISNFWERWHISLSRWIRDYLYIPLGGSRGGLAKTLANLLTTMLLAGAWHGAGWTFIVWGGYHGVLLAISHAFKALRQKNALWQRAAASPIYHCLAVGLTFISVVAGWIFFRAETLSDALTVILQAGHVGAWSSQLVTEVASGHLKTLSQLILLLACCFVGPSLITLREKRFEPAEPLLKLATASALILLCWIFASQDVQTFIYFQF